MRLIDADAIDYDEYWNRNGEGFTIDVCQKAQRIIDEQPTIPSAEAVQGWIPCSERLPSESGWYVISVVGFENITDVSYFYSDESKWSDVSHTQSVIAWMPLPEPYKQKTER